MFFAVYEVYRPKNLEYLTIFRVNLKKEMILAFF